MTVLAHLSDIHLAPLPPVRLADLLGKRATGYLNWTFKRRSALSGAGLETLTTHLHAQQPDFTAITGDLVNLALPAEVAGALAWLRSLGSPQTVCVAPGNHDAYVPGALEHALATYGDYVTGETLDGAAFPFVRRVGEVAIVSCSSAIATPPWIAAGRFDAPQAARLAKCLQLLGDGGYFRVVLIHHPPDTDYNDPRKSLWGARRFREVIAQRGAEMILHGHTHRSTIHTVKGPTGDVPVIGVAAAGAAQGAREHDDPARYNLFRIETLGSTWSCTMREFGFQRLGNDVVLRLQMRIY